MVPDLRNVLQGYYISKERHRELIGRLARRFLEPSPLLPQSAIPKDCTSFTKIYTAYRIHTPTRRALYFTKKCPKKTNIKTSKRKSKRRTPTPLSTSRCAFFSTTRVCKLGGLCCADSVWFVGVIGRELDGRGSVLQNQTQHEIE